MVVCLQASVFVKLKQSISHTDSYLGNQYDIVFRALEYVNITQLSTHIYVCIYKN